MSEDFKINIELKNEEKNLYIASFYGHFDDGNDESTNKVYELIEKTKKLYIIFDMENLKYINSTGIGRVADWYSKVTEEDGNVLVSNAKDDIKEVFDLVGISSIIPFFENNEMAIKSFSL